MGAVCTAQAGSGNICIGGVLCAVQVQLRKSRDLFRTLIQPPVDQVEVVSALMYQQTAGLCHTGIPTTEVAGTVAMQFHITGQQPLEVNAVNIADLTANDQLLDLGHEGSVAVVECNDDLVTGALFSLQNVTAEVITGGHGLFSDNIAAGF